MKVSKLFFWVLILLIATQTQVHAYTDPGSGTLIWQMLLAASFGLAFYLRKIISWFRALKPRKSSTTSTDRTSV
ncbi:MAG: hypothetical protein AB1757_27705 [Acidobacteriota bacterium]